MFIFVSRRSWSWTEADQTSEQTGPCHLLKNKKERNFCLAAKVKKEIESDNSAKNCCPKITVLYNTACVFAHQEHQCYLFVEFIECFGFVPFPYTIEKSYTSQFGAPLFNILFPNRGMAEGISYSRELN